jgi:hypothetical protein
MYDIKVLELKVGDRVGVMNSGGWNPLAEIKTVTKKTATQVVLSDGTRWNKYGRMIGEGSSWHRGFLMTVEEAEKRRADELQRRARLKLIQEVRDFDWKNVSDEGLRVILQVAEGHKL